MTNLALIFKNAYDDNIQQISYSELESVQPFPFGLDTKFNSENSKEVIFLKGKNGRFFYLKVEPGEPRKGIFQLIHAAM